MPFADYKDFDACLKDQISKGHDKESASKICGSIQAKTENMSIKRDEQGREILFENFPLTFSSEISLKND